MTAFAVGMALVAGLSAFPVAAAASAGTAKPSTSAATATASLPAGQPATNAAALPGMPDQALLQLRQPGALTHRTLVPGALAPGTLSGTVRTFSGVPLTGACVTAYGARGGRSTKTAAGGGFVLPGLAAGRYTLEFRDCGHPGRYLPQWSGRAALPAMARQVLVSSAKVTSIAPVNLRPASQAVLFARPSAAQLAREVSQPAAGQPAAASQPGAASPAPGGISGRVTGLHGRPVAHTCVEVHFTDGYFGIPVSSRGTYTSTRILPPGRYTVEFAALDCGANPGNWAPQWYKDKTRAAAANHVTVPAGKITRHIDARLRHGGIISGTVTGRAGANVTGLCVGLFTGGTGALVAVRQPSQRGYSFNGLPAGRYRVLFQPSCTGQSSKYLSQWWKNKPTFPKANRIRVRPGKVVHHIDARLRVGGQITGTVRLGDGGGRPLRGICVDASSGAFLTGFDTLAPTHKNGSYQLVGLPPGSYSIQFFPGCNNEGNLLGATYPHPVRVRDGAIVRHVDAVLQPGGIITGTVINSAGQPLVNIAVFASTPRGNGNAACTTRDGTFTVTQLPPAHYTVLFANQCGLHGSNYAPQYYSNQPNFSSAVPLVVGPAQKVTGIDAKMLPGSSITGTVTDSTGQPAGKVCVQVDQPAEAYLAIEDGFGDFSTIRTSDSGSYHVRNLAAGRYVVRFTECGAARYADRWFGGRPGAPVGDIVNVGTGATVSGVGAVMGQGGAIGGTIRSATGKPVTSSCEVITDPQTDDVVAAPFDSDSHYRIKGLTPGRYSVEFYTCLVGGKYASQWFDRKPGPRTATAVRVTARHATTSVDAALPVGGQITGRLTDKATGKPVRGFCAEASTAGNTFFGFALTRRTGDYAIRGLNTGTYHLVFSNCFGAAATEADLQRSTTVHVTAPRTVSGINAALASGGSIAGVVLAGPGAPAPQGDVCVEADPVSAGAIQSAASTSHTGHYVLPNLPAGTYRVRFDTTTECDNSQNGLLPQWYKAAATRATAATVTVLAGQRTPGIDATLRAAGGISGRVTAAPAGTPLAGICVRAVRRSTGTGTAGAGTPASFAASAASDGGYSLTGLVPGRYTVRFSSGCGATGYATRWWRHAATSARANVITVHADTIATAIDIALTPAS